MNGSIRISLNEGLSLATDHQIAIAYVEKEGKRRIQEIRSIEATKLFSLDSEKEEERTLFCPGTLLIDPISCRLILCGKGGEQVFFDDGMGEMYADRVEVEYNWEKRKAIPKKIFLEGNVRLHNRFDGNREGSRSILHLALANQVEYWPEQGEMVLKGIPGERVLCIDRVNRVEMSAPAFHMRYDPCSKKEVIEGVGDVRFTFLEKEWQIWKRHFSSDEGRSKGKGSGV